MVIATSERLRHSKHQANGMQVQNLQPNRPKPVIDFATMSTMANRRIHHFATDEDDDWVAVLKCGHRQHVRHKPPWQNRPWVLTAEGRQTKIGELLDCQYCDMPSLPENAQVYRTTPIYSEQTLPQGLTRDHQTKPNVWGRIIVLSGQLSYEICDPEERCWVLRPGVPGTIAPQTRHRVRVSSPVQFRVEFLKVADKIT